MTEKSQFFYNYIYIYYKKELIRTVLNPYQLLDHYNYQLAFRTPGI